ncbi:50S ribosomal protein L19 [Candidatus Woesebacteria bacterium]|nr:MAG: 50S ribosomal protein L19 [Candidatus Woesebacteria bacterium]
MALYATHNNTKFGVGDTIRVSQKIKEGDKTRIQVFEGMVIKIKGRDVGKTFTVRRIGSQRVGIERIYPLFSPIIQEINVVKSGVRGVRHAKIYYTRDKSTKEISKIQSRANRRGAAKLKYSSKKDIHKVLIAKNTSLHSSKKSSKKISKPADAGSKK